MTDNEIVKALELCKACTTNTNCSKCPYSDEDDCIVCLCEGSFDLINRQKEEIEKWQTEYKRACAERDAHIVTTKFAKAEAVKEFADKAKEKMRDLARVDFQGVDYYLIGKSLFDNLVKEMVGDNNEE